LAGWSCHCYRLWTDTDFGASLVKIDSGPDGWPAQTGQLNDLHHAKLPLMQTDNLLAPLVQLGKALRKR